MALGFKLFTQKNIMCSDSAEDNCISLEMECKAVFHSYGAFPYVLGPLDFFDPERWMKGIV